ncbi:nicotinate-nucleotide adenylyltransferase [Atlantibacter hermannii]|uniref:nicotinate-nucleotide adenylyltransferase n=1 Tax=Atlantibacter hermannii TaxID=565 RepID=UPI0028B1B861|nr:nicotinate-nucleotide adenylyltransferase [Atlantibacter hermannii]MCQ4969784.1 nicotinate-nucleotide adenylyltransferase [Enterobacteriaceae bacterium DFI.7.85]
MDKSLLAWYGGTFDPIHFGHIKPVEALAQRVGLKKVVIMPNNVPPHRPQPKANSAQRKAMIEAAIQGNPLFELDDRELQREMPSWTADTMETLRTEQGATQPLGFIIGQDSLLTFQTWHRYADILACCHLLVCRRPGYALTMPDARQQRWLEQHLATDIAELHSQPAGKIFLAETPLLNISATVIRQRLEQGQPCDDLVPAPVMAYITHHGLYRQ